MRKSLFSFDGHPFHPMLIALPIGLFVWTLAADAIYLGTGKDDPWYDISFYTGIAAIATALLAALPGFGDYFTMPMDDRARLTATSHMVLNLTVVALFAAALVFAWDDGARTGTNLTVMVALHAIANGLLVVSGWLGGHLVYILHLAVVPEGELHAEDAATRGEEQRRTGRRMGSPQAR